MKQIFTLIGYYPDNKVHGANMGTIWGRQDPGGPHVGPMNFAIWVYMVMICLEYIGLYYQYICNINVISLKMHTWQMTYQSFAEHLPAILPYVVLKSEYIEIDVWNGVRDGFCTHESVILVFVCFTSMGININIASE